MSGESDWRRRRSIHGREQLGRVGEPLTNRASGSERPDPNTPADDPGLLVPGGVAADSADEAPDLSEVAFDENFLDALVSGVPVPTRDTTEYQLAELLSGWRSEAVSTPTAPLVSVDDVERAIAHTERASRGRRMVRHLRVVSGAAAIVIVAAAGLTVLSEGSKPGDPLWAVKEVVFSEQASETQAAYDVRSNLERAEAAIAAGDTSAAVVYIQKAEEKMGPMRDKGTRREMSEWVGRLRGGAGMPATDTSAEPSRASATTPDASDKPDLRIQSTVPSPSDRPAPPSSDEEVPGGPVDEPGTSEEPQPTSPPSQSKADKPSLPSTSSASRTPAQFPTFPWSPPPGVDASKRKPG